MKDLQIVSAQSANTLVSHINLIVQRKVVNNMTTNSMLNPADSLTPILHFPNRNGTCYYCNETITFVAGLNRYVGNSGIRCKEAK